MDRKKGNEGKNSPLSKIPRGIPIRFPPPEEVYVIDRAAIYATHRYSLKVVLIKLYL